MITSSSKTKSTKNMHPRYAKLYKLPSRKPGYSDHNEEDSMFPWGGRGTRVYAQKPSKLVGIRTGHVRSCNLEGCRGLRLHVVWPDGHATWCCTKALRDFRNGLRIA